MGSEAFLNRQEKWNLWRVGPGKLAASGPWFVRARAKTKIFFDLSKD
jgi:hypothetical protein